MKKQDFEQLTLFQGDSPASRLVQPGSAEAVQMTVTSGRRCSELYRRSDPVGWLVRMLLASSVWRSTRCFLTWKASATPAKRWFFRLVPSTPRTEGTGLRLWPTTTKRDYKGSNSMEHLQREGKHHQGQLANFVKLFPTPTTGAGMCGGSGNYQKLKDLENSGQISGEERRSMAAGNGGQLNPDWVEWLMGFQIGWTEV